MNRRRETLNAINHWDFWVGVASGVAIGALWCRIQFKPDAYVVTSLITLVVGTLAFIETTKMSLFDKLLESEYGEIVRQTDPRQERVMIMYVIGRYVSLGAAGLGIAATIVTNSVDDWRIQAPVVALAVGAIVWMVMIFVSLKNWQDYFMGQIAQMRSMRERVEREEIKRRVENRGPRSSQGSQPLT